MKKMFTAIVVIMMVALAFTVVASAAENYTANDAGLYEISVDSSVIGTVDEGTQYGMVVVEATGDEAFALDQATIRYIDQTGVASGTITFEAFAPMELASNGTYKVYIGGGNLTEATYIGTLEVEEEDPTVAVTSVTLDKASLSLEKGASETLTATVVPSNATNQTVEWKSDDEAVATVKNGVVTAVGAGSTTITVTTVDGSKTATCAVTVTETTPPVTERTPGDANEDGKIRTNDASRILQYVTDSDNTKINLSNADVTGDGKIRTNDASRILQYVTDPDNTTLK